MKQKRTQAQSIKDSESKIFHSEFKKKLRNIKSSAKEKHYDRVPNCDASGEL